MAALDKEKKSLAEIGLSPKALGEFSQRIEPVARRHDITPEKLRDRLLRELENLEHGLSLETLIQDRQLELEKKEKAVTLAKQEQESLEAANNSLKQEKENLEASIRETREKLSKEMAKIVPAARATINSVVKELQSGHGKVLDEVRRLRDEALEVGREVGRFEEMLQANLWLRELLTLVRGEEGIEGKRVRAIVLKVLRSAEPWLKDNEANKWGFSTLTLATDNLIKELEKWKT